MSRWFAIQSHTGDEHKAVESLQRMGFNAQCPVAVERRVRHRRSAVIKQEVERPLFNGYFFVECEYVPAWFRNERHIIRPLWSWEFPQAIPDHLVRNALSMSGIITVNEWREVQRFHAGEMVRHRSGLVGKVDEVKGNKLVMLVELLCKLHRQTVQVEHVEAAE